MMTLDGRRLMPHRELANPKPLFLTLTLELEARHQDVLQGVQTPLGGYFRRDVIKRNRFVENDKIRRQKAIVP